MSDINQIINTVISRETARVTKKGFGTPIVIGVHSKFTERIRTYLDITAVGEDFASTSEEYIVANMLFSQQFSPKQIKIGRRATTSAQSNVVSIGGTIAVDDVFSVTINRVTYSFTATTAVANDVAAGLGALIDTSADLSAIVAGSDITITQADVDTSFYIQSASATSTAGTISVANSTGSVEAIADTLAAISAEDDDYYGVLHTKRSTLADRITDITDMATAIEALEKLTAFSTNQAEAITAATTDIFSTLKGLSRFRTAGIWSATDYEYPEAGWFGLQLPKTPGSTNWKFKTISGATPSKLSGTAYTNLKNKNANFVETVGGLNIVTSEAVVVGGEYVDIMRGVDALTAGIQEDTFAYMASMEKIPFTNAGMQATCGPLKTQLISFSKTGLLVGESIVVNIPDASEISTADKASRKFKGTTFSAQLQGAINFTEIRGKVYP